MNGTVLLELAGAVWTIARIVGPFLIDHVPGWLGSA